MVRRGGRRLASTAAALAAGCGGLLGAGAGTASAGTYHMYNCAPPGVNIAAQTRGPWTYEATSPSSQIQDNCGAAPGTAQFGVSNNNNIQEIGHAGWTLTPPAAIGVVSVRTFVGDNVTCSTGTCSVLMGPPGFAGFENSRSDYAAGGKLGPVSDPPARTYSLQLICSNANCTYASYQPMEVFGTDTTLSEGVAPTGTIQGGTLLTPGVHATPASVSFTAGDADSGVQRVEALLGDTVAGTADFARDLSKPVAQQSGNCTYTSYAACPTSQSGDVQVDPSKAPGGTQPLRLRVIDAAGNATIVPGPTVQVAGGTQPSTPNGTNATRDAKLVARYATTKRRSRTLGYHTRPTVRGRLTAKSGAPISGAAVVVIARERASRAPLREVSRVTTNARGEFQLKVPGGASRDLLFTYTAFSSDTAAAARSKLRTAVHAKLSASLHPKRPRARAKARVTGKLRYLARSGVTVVVQARDGKVWRPLGQTKTRAKGRYTFTYRFKRSARGRTLALRARVDSPNYPFAPGTSNKLRLRVR